MPPCEYAVRLCVRPPLVEAFIFEKYFNFFFVSYKIFIKFDL